MNWLLNLIPGGSLTVLLGAIGAMLATIGVVWRKATVSERNRNLAKEAKAREKHIEEITAAASAKPTGSVRDDPDNRDNDGTKTPVHNVVDTGSIQRKSGQSGNRGRKPGA